MDIHLSGAVLYTSDPLEVLIENLYIETGDMTNGLDFIISCNYPEANQTSSFSVKNFTAATTTNPSPAHSAVLTYNGPGNISYTDIDISKLFSLASIGSTTFYATNNAVCSGNDDLTKTIDGSNFKTSLPDNESLTK